MKLKITNFGPIKEAEIDLTKRTYIFVGYNNTGKTLLSQLLFALFDNNTLLSSFDFLRKKLSGIVNFERNEFLIDDKILSEFGNLFCSSLKENLLSEIFKTPKSHFLFRDASFSLSFPDLDFIASKEIEESLISFNENGDKNYLKINKDKGSLAVTLKSDSTLEVGSFAYAYVFFVLFFDKHIQGIYLPASRIFYPTFYRYIYSIEKDRREKMSKEFQEVFELRDQGKIDYEELGRRIDARRDSFKIPYTEPMNSLIEKIYDLKDNQGSKLYKKELQWLEKIMGGEIVAESVEGISPSEFYLKIDKDKKLDMFLSSSSVNQLTTLYLFFKYWVRDENNFLIIDEPEENLHPAAQKDLLHALVSYNTKNNNRLLLVNHTPLFAELINNYLMLGSLHEKVSEEEFSKITEELGVDPLYLEKEKVAVYFFDGTTVREYEIGDYGTIFKDFDRVVHETKRTSEKLSELIFEKSKSKNNHDAAV